MYSDDSVGTLPTSERGAAYTAETIDKARYARIALKRIVNVICTGRSGASVKS